MFGFSKFRKRLGLYSFKLSKNSKFKNPHGMPLAQKNYYKKKGYEGEIKIRAIERESQRPFGKVSRKGKFVLNIDKVPFYNIPDVNEFKVKILLPLPLILYTNLLNFTAETLCSTYNPKN